MNVQEVNEIIWIFIICPYYFVQPLYLSYSTLSICGEQESDVVFWKLIFGDKKLKIVFKYYSLKISEFPVFNVIISL